MTEYIEKDAVINDIGDMFTICYETLPNECGHHFIVEKELQTHLDFVRNLPAADVRPNVYAKWEISCDGWYPYCSNCKQEPQGRIMTSFCPNCGAKMEAKE